MAEIGGNVKDDEEARLSDVDADTKRWVAGLTLTGTLMTILLVIGLSVSMTASDVDRACFQKEISDEHMLMEAFFQNPSAQNAIAEAMRACRHASAPLRHPASR